MASIIDTQTAKSLILEYQAQNSSATGPGIITPAGQFLNGYFIDRTSIETVLSEPDFDGLSLYLAITPGYSGSGKNIFTIMFVGASINSGGPTAYTNSGDIYDNIPPCPTECGDLV